MLRRGAAALLLPVLVACSSERPGPLEGTWAVTDPFPVTVTFRQGEMEALGITRKVTYRRAGDEVLVTYQQGPTKGSTFRYTVVDADTIRSDSGTFHRVKRRP